MSYPGSIHSDRRFKPTRDPLITSSFANRQITRDYKGRHKGRPNPVHESDSGFDTEPTGRPIRVDESNNGSDADGDSDTAPTGKHIQVDETNYGYDASGESDTDILNQVNGDDDDSDDKSGYIIVKGLQQSAKKVDKTSDRGGDLRWFRQIQHTPEKNIVRTKPGASISLKGGGLKKKQHNFKIGNLFKRSSKQVAVQVKSGNTFESKIEDGPEDIQQDVGSLKQHSPEETSVRTKAVESDSIKEAYPYDITVTTGDNPNAGTTSNVFIELIGENNLTSGKLSLPRGKFDRGKSHKFHKLLPLMLSPLISVGIGHDNSGDSPDWFCEQVIVYSHKTGFKQVFPCQKWLQIKDDQNILQRQLFENTELTAFKTGKSTSGTSPKEDLNTCNAVFNYGVTIVTGKEVNSGTDAQVYINFHGKQQADVEKIKIPEECSTGSSYRCLVQLEFAMEYIEVGHDNTGTNPDWFCDHVKVYCPNSGIKHIFRCEHWLSKSMGDGLIKRKLYASHDLHNKGLQKMCKQYGRSSTEVQEACNNITIQIIACSKSFKQVWSAYQPSNPDNIVFVVSVESEISEDVHRIPKQLNSFNITYRATDRVHQEDNEIFEKNVFSVEEKGDEERLVDILKKSSKKLMESHSNLTMISASPVKSKYFAKGPDKHKVERKPCIVFYVGLKGYIPIREKLLPTHLGTYVTDVREGIFKLFQGKEEFCAKLKIGCSVGENTATPTFGGTGGTLGAFIDLPNENVGCITSAHTLFSEDKLINLKGMDAGIDYNLACPTIYQPAPSISQIQNNTPFGYVSSAVYKKGGDRSTGVEVGVITITDQSRIPENGKFPKVVQGFTEESQPDYSSGIIYTDLPDDIKQYSFYKYGATTGFTRGAFRLEGGAVRTSTMDLHPTCELHNQLEICSVDTIPFAEPGDSGALVLLAPNNDLKDLRAIGILTGGTTSCTVFYVTPIWEVLKALHLP